MMEAPRRDLRRAASAPSRPQASVAPSVFGAAAGAAGGAALGAAVQVAAAASGVQLPNIPGGLLQGGNAAQGLVTAGVGAAVQAAGAFLTANPPNTWSW